MEHPEPITSLEELENLIFMGCDLWILDTTQMTARSCSNPWLEQKEQGKVLYSSNYPSYYVQWFGVNDPTFKYDSTFTDMFIYETQQAATNALSLEIIRRKECSTSSTQE